MLRIHFTAEDLARVRVTASWGPLAETMFSLSALGDRNPSILVDGWRESVHDHMGERARPLLALLQPLAGFDLTTLVGEVATIDEGLEALLGASGDHVRQEVEHLLSRQAGAPHSTRAWMLDLSRGSPAARRQLAAHLRAYYGNALEPFWDAVRSQLEVDRAIRGRIMAEGGVDRLLATLHPGLRWEPPVLEVRRPALPGWPRVSEDTHLDGRSLVLLPSVFSARPVVCYSTLDDTLPPVLVYPALRDLDDALSLGGSGGHGRVALEALLGRSRALALEATTDPCTTGELARRIGVSAATASHHTSVLRGAGLISTRRNGSAVLHTITTRGAMLLDAPRRPASTDSLRSA